MGATKRICELYCQSLAGESSIAFLSVTFGNVLASQGSVVPIFMEKIARSGPVTVTHPDMKRYFMSIPEAVTLVMQAAVLGRAGQVMFLDMGQPIRIVDLVERLIELSGRPKEALPIHYFGLVLSEKLFEELTCTEESCISTVHEKIKVLKSDTNGNLLGKPIHIEQGLEQITKNGDSDFAASLLRSLVPEYTMAALKVMNQQRFARLA